MPGSSQGPAEAILDGSIPGEAGDKYANEGDDAAEKDRILEEWSEPETKLQKACRTMGDLCMDAKTIQGALTCRAHLMGLLQEAKKHADLLEPATQTALAALAMMNTLTNT